METLVTNNILLKSECRNHMKDPPGGEQKTKTKTFHIATGTETIQNKLSMSLTHFWFQLKSKIKIIHRNHIESAINHPNTIAVTKVSMFY